MVEGGELGNMDGLFVNVKRPQNSARVHVKNLYYKAH